MKHDIFISREMKRRGMSMEELAILSGVSRSRVYSYLNQQSGILFGNALKIFHTMGYELVPTPISTAETPNERKEASCNE